MKRIAALLLLSGRLLAQTLTIPAQTFTQNVTVNGTTVSLTLTVPSQTVQLPASGGGSLPSGLTWSNGVFAVAGSISATSVSMTGGPSLPSCANNLYLWQFVAASGATPASLQPVCYVLPILTIPPITVSQTGINTITLTP